MRNVKSFADRLGRQAILRPAVARMAGLVRCWTTGSNLGSGLSVRPTRDGVELHQADSIVTQ